MISSNVNTSAPGRREDLTVDQALFVSVTVVQQALDFINSNLADSQLTFESKLMPGGTIGARVKRRRFRDVLM